MKVKQIVEKYRGELEHFFVPGVGGWPLVEKPHHKKLAILVPALKLENGLLKKNPKVKLDTEVMLGLYRLRYEELESMYDKLYRSVLAITEKF